MADIEKGHARKASAAVRTSIDGRPSVSKRRASLNPEIELLRRRRDELHRNYPEVVEAERLRKEIEALERESRKEVKEEEHQAKKVLKAYHGVKFVARPKLRAYFEGTKLFRSRGDHEWAATTSISLFTDLLFVGVLAETGSLAVSNDDGIDIVNFVIQFLPCWRIWCYIRDIVALYEMNAVSQRFIILWILCLLVTFTVK
jgi:hypothetical protein